MIAFCDATRHLYVHQLAWPRVTFDHGSGQVEPLVEPEWIGDPNPVEAALQPDEMLTGAKWRTHAVERVDRNDLVNTVAKNEAAIEH